MKECCGYLLEPRELVEQHAEHHLARLRGQVGQEEDLVGRGVVHTSLGGSRGGGAGASRGSNLNSLLL